MFKKLFLTTFLILSIVCSVNAATITRHVNTDSTAGGDGTTNATEGDNRAYATLAEWKQQLK